MLYELHVFILGCDGGRTGAHSNVLATASPILREKLTGHGRMMLKIEDISFSTWNTLLDYIYTGQVHI